MSLMNFDGIAPELFGRDVKCPLQCPDEHLPCNCKPTETCVIIPRQCNKCAYITCTPNTPSSGGGGVNPGVIAGPIVGVALIAASLVLFWWLRRKKRRDLARLEDLAERARKGESSAFHLSTPGSPTAAVTRSRHASQVSRSPVPGATTMQQTQAQRATLPNVPADAEYYDENGTTIRVYTGKRGAINADPNHPDNGGNGDPFADSRSMSTAGSGHSTNVIPIHYVPGSQSSDTLAKVLHDHNIDPRVATADQQAAAARTLDLARQNLFRPQNAKLPPPRPARAPDLDLRLNPPVAKGLGQLSDAAASRTSVGSFNSASPSFLSTNTSDVHLDTPKIVTRQQVHVGRLHTAEVVHVSNLHRSPATPPETAGPSVVTDPFASEGETRGSLDSRNFDDDAHPMSQPSPTDLRFSMGSLAFDRASVSTTSTTGRRPPVLPIERHRFESISSSHSAGGESLGNFPMMITPVATTGSLRALGAVPQNMSTATLDMAGAPGGPPVSRGVLPSDGDPRPLTTASSHSAADSFFGSFPFLPPNINADGSPGVGRTMSSTSEGLGGFEFSFDGQAQDAADAAGSKEHVEDPTTPRAPTAPRRW